MENSGTLLKGTHRLRIDPKGRLPVPAPFRRQLAQSLVATALDQCLAVYASAEWERLEGQLVRLPAFNKDVKALTRLLASRAADCEMDVQGRILLPAGLRASAGLARDVVVIGVLNRFEVWSPERWEGFVNESERLLDDVSLDVAWPIPPPGDRPTDPRPGDPQSRPLGDPQLNSKS